MASFTSFMSQPILPSAISQALDEVEKARGLIVQLTNDLDKACAKIQAAKSEFHDMRLQLMHALEKLEYQQRGDSWSAADDDWSATATLSAGPTATAAGSTAPATARVATAAPRARAATVVQPTTPPGPGPSKRRKRREVW